jgi:hypothetical protein
VLHLDDALPRETLMLPIAVRLGTAASEAGFQLELVTGPREHPRLAIHAVQSEGAPAEAEGYRLGITKRGVAIEYRDHAGLRCASATLRQLIAEYGRELPCCTICDFPDFARRGVMLDISRGRVPNLGTLLGLVEILADFKVNEFQLYTEHTFAYRNYEEVWRDWGALSGEEILQLDARCRQLGIDFVPNQNSFGHLRYWLEYPPLKKIAETTEPYEGSDGTFLRFPTTLAPTNRETLPFICGLFDELLPYFTSKYFNAGCDETWDLGRGQSKAACEKMGKHRVYLDFVRQIHREVSKRSRKMMFWGDIILNHPELIKELPRDIIALNWGYEKNHPFERETALLAQSGVPFYVCPGTATWMTLIGRHDTSFANLRAAADAGRKNGAAGYLNTDWGDGGHPQPLAVSHLAYALGAAFGWCAKSFDEKALIRVASRDVFHDPSQRAAEAALGLGFAHQKFEYYSSNVTPFGAVIAAPRPKTRELFCRDGLKYYARIPAKNIRSAREEAESQRAVLYRSKPTTPAGEMLALELDLAARMALQSCDIMLWQQALAAGDRGRASQMAKKGIRALQEIDADFRCYWPLRNKGSTAKSTPFLKWRVEDYKDGKLHFPPEVARVAAMKTYAAE